MKRSDFLLFGQAVKGNMAKLQGGGLRRFSSPAEVLSGISFYDGTIRQLPGLGDLKKDVI